MLHAFMMLRSLYLLPGWLMFEILCVLTFYKKQNVYYETVLVPGIFVISF